MGISFNRYINSKIRTKYIDGDGTGAKPKKIYSTTLTRKPHQFGYSSRGKIWDRGMKKTKQNFGRKKKPTGYIYFPRPQYCESEAHLKLSSCLHDFDNNSSPKLENTLKT